MWLIQTEKHSHWKCLETLEIVILLQKRKGILTWSKTRRRSMWVGSVPIVSGVSTLAKWASGFYTPVGTRDSKWSSGPEPHPQMSRTLRKATCPGKEQRWQAAAAAASERQVGDLSLCPVFGCKTSPDGPCSSRTFEIQIYTENNQAEKIKQIFLFWKV